MWSDFFHGICSFRLFSKGSVRRNGAVCLRRPILFCLARKEWGEKRRREREIALTRLKRHFDSACHSPMARPVRNALRAAVQSGFPSAQYTVRVVLFAPVEYLTYGSRKAVFFARAATHIARKRTSAQGTFETDAEYFDYHAGLSKTHL